MSSRAGGLDQAATPAQGVARVLSALVSGLPEKRGAASLIWDFFCEANLPLNSERLVGWTVQH